MTGDKELLTYISENINMGLTALESLIKDIEKTDNKIKSNIYKAHEEYKKYQKNCNKLLKKHDVEPSKGSMMSTVMTKMGTKMEFVRDNSDSKIAETLVQGYNMGILDITKKLNNFKGDISREVQCLAEDYKKMMQSGIESVKGFL